MSRSEDNDPSREGHDLVRLTTAGGQFEASTLRGYLTSNGVHCHIQGEQHNALLGGLGHFLIELHVLVPRRDLELARELLTAFRDAEPIYDEEDWGGADGPGGLEDEDEDEDAALQRARELGSLRRRDPRVAAVLALVPSFGFSHFYTGAFMRGAVLAGVEGMGLIALLTVAPLLGALLVATAVGLDLMEGTRRARRLAELTSAEELPRMKLVKRDGGS